MKLKYCVDDIRPSGGNRETETDRSSGVIP